VKEKTRRIFLWVLGLSTVLLIGITAVDWIVMDGVMPTDIRSWVTLLTPFFTIMIAFVIVVNSKPTDN